MPRKGVGMNGFEKMGTALSVAVLVRQHGIAPPGSADRDSESRESWRPPQCWPGAPHTWTLSSRYATSEMKQHRYEVRMSWTGNLGEGTKCYTGYLRNHEIVSAGKSILPGSSDPSFRDDPARYLANRTRPVDFLQHLDFYPGNRTRQVREAVPTR
jgi:hypothetical protein